MNNVTLRCLGYDAAYKSIHVVSKNDTSLCEILLVIYTVSQKVPPLAC